MRSSPTRAAAGRSRSRPTTPNRSRSSSPGCCATRPPRSATPNRRARTRLRLARDHRLRPLPPGRSGGSRQRRTVARSRDPRWTAGRAPGSRARRRIPRVPAVEAAAPVRRADAGTGRRDPGPRNRSAAPGGWPAPRPGGKARLLRFPLEMPAEPVALAEPALIHATEAEDIRDVGPEASLTEPQAAPAEPQAPVAWAAPATPAIQSWSSVVAASPAAASPGRPPIRRADHPDPRAPRQTRGGRARKGELKELVSGRVMPFRGPRPASLRVRAGTGTLLLSFDSKEARDRAAAELIGEAGLLIRDTGIAASQG